MDSQGSESTDNDFGIQVQTVDQDTAEWWVTDPVSHDDALFAAQIDNEES
jgi:hypothetical protein